MAGQTFQNSAPSQQVLTKFDELVEELKWFLRQILDWIRSSDLFCSKLQFAKETSASYSKDGTASSYQKTELNASLRFMGNSEQFNKTAPEEKGRC